MEDLPLYWTDPSLCDTERIITKAENSGEVWQLELEHSPFYPGGGGQPADRGSISGFPLLEILREEERIIHQVEASGPFAAGKKVHCKVDEEFRRDSMEQHSGQHLLSAALALEGMDTVSVHLGSEYLGIEVENAPEGAGLEEAVSRVLEDCDRWIRENRKVISRCLSPEEAEKLKLRRPAAGGKGGLIRLIEIENLDIVGCGGVHLENTAAIGLILYLGSEKIRGRTRLKWLIGKRALTAARNLNEQSKELQKVLSVSAAEVSQKVKNLLKERQYQKKTLQNLGTRTGRLLAGLWMSEAGEKDFIVESTGVPGGGRELIESALNSLIKEGVPEAFIMDGGAWMFYSREGDADHFGKFHAGVLEKYGAKGGGKAPLWRGRIEGNEKEILMSVREWLGK